MRNMLATPEKNTKVKGGGLDMYFGTPSPGTGSRVLAEHPSDQALSPFGKVAVEGKDADVMHKHLQVNVDGVCAEDAMADSDDENVAEGRACQAAVTVHWQHET